MVNLEGLTGGLDVTEGLDGWSQFIEGLGGSERWNVLVGVSEGTDDILRDRVGRLMNNLGAEVLGGDKVTG